MERPETTRWRRRKDARPAEILDAALSVFAERGFAATRMDDIAARAGVTKGTIYLYFKSKEAVFRSLVRESMGPTLGRFADEIERFEGPSDELLRTILRAISEFILKTDRAVLPKIIVAEAGNFPALAEFYRTSVIDKGAGLLQSIIERGIRRGEFRAVATEHAAKLCFAPFLLAATWKTTFARFDREPYDLDALIECHIDMLLRGLAADEGGRP